MENGIVKLTPELLALMGTGDINALAPFSREIYLLDIVVAGTSFCSNVDELEPLLLPDTVLKMIRQPENEHDKLAIGIYLNNQRIGWVPMEHNIVISRLMDAGKAFFCRVEYTQRKANWLKIKAKIFMVE
ncbi:MAG: HIRAN domain-containing protein [Paludibacter sp.]